MRYMDTYAIHAGVQGVITRFLVARVGGSFDSNAIPDRTVRRENQDNLKGTVAAGLGVHFWKIFIDGAFEVLVPARRASSRRRCRTRPVPKTRPARIGRRLLSRIVGSNTFLILLIVHVSPRVSRR